MSNYSESIRLIINILVYSAFELIKIFLMIRILKLIKKLKEDN